VTASGAGSVPAGASRMLGAPLAYSLLHCEAALPTSLAARDQLLVQSFPQSVAASAASAAAASSASPTAAPTPVYAYGGLTSSSPDTLATLLGQCVEVTRLGRVVNHRMVSYVSGDGLGSNLIVREVRYTAQDRCSGTRPVVSDRQVVYLAKDASGARPCLPDPLYPGSCYLFALRTANVQTDTATAQMPRLLFNPTAVPTPPPPPPPTPSPTPVPLYSLGSAWATGSANCPADTTRVTLCVKVQSSLAGYITQVKFYKPSTSVSTHTGAVWSANGNLLASAVFSGETDSGWQFLTLSSPVSMTANTYYYVGVNTIGYCYSTFPSLSVSPFTIQGSFYTYKDTVTSPGASSSNTNYLVDLVWTAA